ncbi:acyltransferase family protein [Arthrobacter sp. ZGTC212]|uniref:acyltransferase family protein n=1 Tax=Arthrobacter sp. ZGTC212 TaxID=2058899 RepID=UPI0021587461|nr:acyltransferase family protein [Arthrobacter sp. ZGTC212]
MASVYAGCRHADKIFARLKSGNSLSQSTITRARSIQGGSLPPQAPKKSLRTDIQGLRAIAVLAVVADHLTGSPVGGFVGVDIFFVISGFLITGLLLREQEKKGSISFADFYRRRVRRIVPVAGIVLLTTVVSSWALFSTGRAKSITWDGLFALVFGANWQLAAIGTDYMQAEGPVSPLQHFWSLAVEEQFYVVWPWLIVLVFAALAHRPSTKPAVAHRVLAGVFGLVILTTFAYAMWETSTRPTVAYFSTISRTWELAVGALLAVTGSSFSRLAPMARTILGYIGLAGIAWSLWFVTPEMSFPGPWAAAPVIATALVIAAGTGGEQRYLYPLTNPLSGYIGNISYSLYLWHFPVIVLMGSLFTREDVIAWTVMILGMIALSVASYHFIEDPIRKSSWLESANRKARRDKTSLFGATSARAGMGVLVMVTTLLVILALTIPTSAEEAASYKPAPISLSGEAAAAPVEPRTAQDKLAAELGTAISAPSWPNLTPSVDQLKLVPEWIEDKCLNVDAENFARCAYGDVSATKTAVVLGDSVSISWMPGLRESLGKQGWKLQLLTREQCPAIEVPVRQYDNEAGFTEECLAHQRWAAEKVAQMRPDMVIVSSALGTRDRMVSAESESDIMSSWRDATVSKLEELKGYTDGDVVLLSVASRGHNLQECATRVSKPSDCMSNGDTFLKTVAVEQDAATRVEGVRFVSTAQWFCGISSQCPSFAGNTPIFAEGGHLTPEYSVKLAPIIGPALLGQDQP